MSEERVNYAAQSEPKRAILMTELVAVRDQLTDIECQLISLLVTVQRALGKQPSVMTRAERRRG